MNTEPECVVPASSLPGIHRGCVVQAKLLPVEQGSILSPADVQRPQWGS